MNVFETAQNLREDGRVFVSTLLIKVLVIQTTYILMEKLHVLGRENSKRVRWKGVEFWVICRDPFPSNFERCRRPWIRYGKRNLALKHSSVIATGSTTCPQLKLGDRHKQLRTFNDIVTFISSMVLAWIMSLMSMMFSCPNLVKIWKKRDLPGRMKENSFLQHGKLAMNLHYNFLYKY